MEIIVLGFKGYLVAFVGSVDMLTLSRLMISKDGRPEPFRVSTASFDGQPFEDGRGRRFEVEGSVNAISASSAISFPAIFVMTAITFCRRSRSPLRPRGYGINMRSVRSCAARAAECFCSVRPACSMGGAARRPGGAMMN